MIRFIDDYFREIEKGDAGIFAGAGLSVPAGFVDWRQLLRPLAIELELDIDREADLVALAQFHVNSNGNNRSQIHKTVIDAFSSDEPPTPNHLLLAQLPITTWWTTNYDKLLENSLRQAGKIVDVKYTVPQLAITAPRRDAIIYKMHGDVEHANNAIVTRDDYENYNLTHGPFVNALAGDLVSKTFLFIGFSFTDPNLEQILSRIRQNFRNDQRRHYAIFRDRTRTSQDDDASFEHARVRQRLVLADLERYNIKSVLIEKYEEVTEILRELARRYRSRTTFVSSSAADFNPWGEVAVTEFMRALGTELIRSNVRVATGLGLGVGNALFTGAVEQVLRSRNGHIEDWIVVRPFPQAIPEVQRAQLWDRYRKDIIGAAGISLFLFGNKDAGGKIMLADGMRSEFEIARELGTVVLPIGATGSVAAELASDVLAAPGNLLRDIDSGSVAILTELARPTENLLSLVDPIIKLVCRVKSGV